jgi:putative transposase
MLKSIKFRLYPDGNQIELLEKQFGYCRFIYNWALDYSDWEYKNNQTNTFKKDWEALLPNLKLYLPWLKESNSQSLQHELKHLEDAYKRFFKKLGGFPKFKSKYDKQSFHVPQNFKIELELLTIPKIKNIKLIVSKDLSSFDLRSVTISKTKTNKYFVSVLYDDGNEIPEKKEITKSTSLGIDLGIKELAICSNGMRVNNSKFLEHNTKRLRRLQQSFSRKIKDSSNSSKAKKIVASLHEKISNQRSDFLHKTSSLICKSQEVNTICLENLNVKGMMKNHKLAKSISSVSWYEFIRQLEYKSEWSGKNLLKCDRFDPSSKTCNECGLIKEDLKLSDRYWICPCGAYLDRDLNASKNIRDFALSKLYPEDTGNFKSVERRDRKASSMPSESVSMKRKAFA